MTLSPGRWHERVPRDHEGNLVWRRAVNSKAARSPALQRDILAVCKQDLLFYVNTFVYQFNPKHPRGVTVAPFTTWPFQDQGFKVLLAAIQDQVDLLVEKSREMGASWMTVIAQDWLARFHDWQKCLTMSRSEEMVESPDPDSLFWKLDFVHRYLPTWMRDANPVTHRTRFFGYAATNSTNTGVASTGKAGVGGRARWMNIDEFSQIKEDFEVLGRTTDTTSCRVFTGTHKGLGTAFYHLSQRPDIRKLVMHWTEHPEKVAGLYQFNPDQPTIPIILDPTFDFPKDYPFILDGSPTGGPRPGVRSVWYDLQCTRKGSARDVAMDLDINPSGSVSQFYDAVLVHGLMREATPPVWRGYLVYDQTTGRPQRLVEDPAGKLLLWAYLDDKGKPRCGECGAGADIGMGQGATPSCLSMIAVRSGLKVLEYADATMKPDQFATLVVALCWLFKAGDDGARLCWEGNGPGTEFGKCVLALGYRSVYWRTPAVTLTKRPSQEPGFFPSPENKRLLHGEYQRGLRTRTCTNLSKGSLEELLAFQLVNQGRGVEHSGETRANEPAGATVNHGDMGTADALAWMMALELGAGVKPYEAEPEPQQLVLPSPGSLSWRRQLAEAEAKSRSSSWVRQR